MDENVWMGKLLLCALGTCPALEILDLILLPESSCEVMSRKRPLEKEKAITCSEKGCN